jgi:hypothetical protein
MTSPNPLTTVGLMLTLASLLGSFFYIQLSQWLRDVVALRMKVDLNKLEGTEAQKRAIVECRIEHARLTAPLTYAVNGVVILFVLFVLGNGLLMIQRASEDVLYPYILWPIVVFTISFIVLSGLLLWQGASNARYVRSVLDGLSG